ncbi:transcriptional regulator BetI [Thorsellia kenyensis]|uniref:HTH-type transcriptional regulator BetI n=1 Tax=Thorsellia kenyensis TaxID=1549888 RepID=A0ABV6C907_9GAMM
MRKAEIPAIRKQQLIEATFSVIEVRGIQQTTINHVAKTAGLSVGIVSHYFGDKNGLMRAVMQKVLSDLKHAINLKMQQNKDNSARGCIVSIIEGNFDTTQVNRAAMKVWLNFWASSLYSDELSQLQKINDHRLYSNLTWYLKKLLPSEKARIVAKGLAAIIDGLWLRGSLSQKDEFNKAEAIYIAIEYLDLQLAKYQDHLVKK